MGYYFSLMPHGVNEYSPESMGFYTAPSSCVGSPMKSELVRSVSETYNPLDDHSDEMMSTHGKVERDVERREHEVDQLPHIGDATRRDIEAFRRDSHMQDLTTNLSTPPMTIPQPKRTPPPRPKLVTPQNSPSPPSPTLIFRPGTPYRTRHPSRSFSASSVSSTHSPPTSSPFGLLSPPLLKFHQTPSETQIRSQIQNPPPPPSQTPTQPTDLETLKSSLSVIQKQISLLDKGIKLNIASQIAAIPASPISGPGGQPLVVMDANFLPGFKVGSDGDGGVGTSRALLETVKVACVLERGLEAVISVFDNNKDGGESIKAERVKKLTDSVNEREKKRDERLDLMSACLERSEAVKKEMGSALEGIEGVIRFDRTKK